MTPSPVSGNPFDAPGGETNPFDAGGLSSNPFDNPSAAMSTGQPAVNWSPLTPIKGVFTGLGRMAQGLTALGAAAVHDVIGGVQEFIPGEQSIEQEGYRLAAIGRAFVPSLASDYAKRYGGLSNIARGLWEDPLSYISDALLIGGAVGLAAKAGRVGAILGKLPMELVSDEAAARILGAGEEAAYKATLQLGNTSLKAGVLDVIPLSRNPATRFLQTKAAEAFSLPAVTSKLDFMNQLDQPEFIRAQGVINYAAQNGIRVLRPSVGRALAGRRAAYTLSKLKVVSQDIGQSESARIVAALDRADDPMVASAYLRGNATPTTPGRYDAVPVGTPTRTVDDVMAEFDALESEAEALKNKFAWDQADQDRYTQIGQRQAELTGNAHTDIQGNPVLRRAYLEKMKARGEGPFTGGGDNLPNATRMGQNATAELAGDVLPPNLHHVELFPDRPSMVVAGAGEDIPFSLGQKYGDNWLHTNINTPHDPRHVVDTGDELTRGIPHTYTILVDSMDDAERVAQEALATAGLKPIGVRNYMMDDSVAYDGFHVIGQADDGAIADISIATKDLHEAQVANSHLMEHMDLVEEERIGLVDALAAEAAKGDTGNVEDSIRIADELKDVEYEAQATDALQRSMFRGHRYGYWVDKSERFDDAAMPALQRLVDEQASANAPLSPTWADDVMPELPQRLSAPDGGATIDPHTGQYIDAAPGQGGVGLINGTALKISLAQASDPVTLKAAIEQLVRDNADAFKNPNARVGLWHNPETHMIELDPSEVRPMSDALLLGRARNQQAVFDFDTFESIPVEQRVIRNQDLLAAENARSVTFNTISSRYFKNNPRAASTYMERAYAEQRVFKFYGMLADTKGSLSSIFMDGNKVDVTDQIARNLLDSGIPEPLVTEMMGSRRWWGSATAEQATKRADRFANRMNKTLHDYMVKEGGRGLELGFPEFDWRVMQQARLEAGLPLPSYFPHFPNAKASQGLTNAKGIVERDPGITKGWTGMLLEEGRVLDDPAEAYTRAAAIMVQHDEAAKALEDLMDDVGRELSPREVIDWRGNQYDGEVMVPVDVLKGNLSRRAEIMGDTLDGMAQGKDISSATLDAAHMLQERALTEGLNAIAGSRMYAVPRAVMRQFEKSLKMQFGHAMRMYWDGPMNVWKAAVLSLSPRWLVNNMFGNQFFMGIENPGAMRLALEQMDRKTAHITEQLFGAYATTARQGFFSDAQRFGESIPEDAGGFLGQVRRVQHSTPGEALSTIGGKVRRRNQFIEQSARRGVLVNEVQRRAIGDWVQGFHSTESILKRALSEGNITPQLMAEGLKGVDKTLGNFTQFGVYEQGILKRFLVPFWGFYRHAAKVLIRLPFEHPLKAAVLKNISAIDDQMHEGEPDWLRSRFRLGDFGGDDLMLNVQNLNPLSQFSEQFTQGQSVVGVLNPIVKMVLERQLGVDTYTGEPFRTPDNVIQTWDGSYYEMQYATDGSYLGVKLLDGAPVPGLANHLLSQFPQLTFFPSFQRYPKSVLLQLASTLGVPLSQIDMEGTIQRQAESQASAEVTAQNRLAGAGNPFDTAA